MYLAGCKDENTAPAVVRPARVVVVTLHQLGGRGRRRRSDQIALREPGGICGGRPRRFSLRLSGLSAKPILAPENAGRSHPPLPGVFEAPPLMLSPRYSVRLIRVNFAGRGGSFDGLRVSQPSTACLDFRLASRQGPASASSYFIPLYCLRLFQILSEVNAPSFAYAANLPDPDLIIRTSGEIRPSGFLLWQSVHTEFYFTDVLWPALRKVDFLRAISAYQARNRRFGR